MNEITIIFYMICTCDGGRSDQKMKIVRPTTPETVDPCVQVARLALRAQLAGRYRTYRRAAVLLTLATITWTIASLILPNVF